MEVSELRKLRALIEQIGDPARGRRALPPQPGSDARDQKPQSHMDDRAITHPRNPGRPGHWTRQMTDLSILDVRLHGRSIGTMTYIGGERSLFAFSDALYRGSGTPHSRAALQGQVWGSDHRVSSLQMKLMPFFSNLLPEGHLRHYLAEKAPHSQRSRVPASCRPSARISPGRADS